MKLLPLSLLALASLLAQSAVAVQGELGQELHFARTLPPSYHSSLEGGKASSTLTYRADRPSTSTLARRGGAQRRSIWQVLFGTGESGQKRRAVPSARIRQRRRLASPRKRSGSCKAASLSSSVAPPSATVSTPPATNTPAPPSPTNSTNTTRTSTNKIMAGYWPDWVSSSFPASSIDFSKFDIVNYAFALPTSNFDLSIPTDPSGGLLRSFVSACKAGNTSAVLSIGGWGGSTYFSPAVRTNSTRATFIANIMKLYNEYNLDGIDLDWEYPGQVGAGNQYDPSDTANFQSFLQELRAALPKGALLTGAVSLQPWTSSNGQPVGSVARAAGVMDYIMIMNYDVWGSSSTPGPNAPLANLCGNSTQPTANAAAGVKAWSAAGMPRSKILLGIPAYGYINTSTKRTLRTRSLLPGRSEQARRRAVQLTSMDGSTSSGQINFNTLISSGALTYSPSTGLYDGSGGYTKYWDDCSDTPYLASGSTVVTYDDTSSIFDKGAFASAAGIGGISMWSIDGDTKDGALTSAAIAGMGSMGAISQ